jgi:hypothetical protein
MPQYNVRAFATDSNQMRSGGDYINRKKAATLYTTVSTNTKGHEKDNLAVSITEGGGQTSNGYDISRCIWSVGGYNVNSYDLYLNVAKGRYYTAPTGRAIGIDPNYYTSYPGPISYTTNISGDVYINDCSGTTIAPSTVANVKGIGPLAELERNGIGNIYDGTLLTNMRPIDASLNDLSGCICETSTEMLNKEMGIDGNLFSSTSENLQVAGKRIARLALAQPLRGFQFPNKFSIPRPPKK